LQILIREQTDKFSAVGEMSSSNTEKSEPVLSKYLKRKLCAKEAAVEVNRIIKKQLGTEGVSDASVCEPIQKAHISSKPSSCPDCVSKKHYII
jgi:hypothetical protein